MDRSERMMRRKHEFVCAAGYVALQRVPAAGKSGAMKNDVGVAESSRHPAPSALAKKHDRGGVVVVVNTVGSAEADDIANHAVTKVNHVLKAFQDAGGIVQQQFVTVFNSTARSIYALTKRVRRTKKLPSAGVVDEEKAAPRLSFNFSRQNLAQIRKEALQRMNDSKYKIAAASMARLAAIVLLFPLDTLKSNLQLQASSGRKLRAALRKSVPVFRGLPQGIAAHVPGGVLAFLLYDLLDHSVLGKASNGNATEPNGSTRPLRSFAAACVADFLVSFWVVPFEQWKVKLQTGSYMGKASMASTYQGWFTHVKRDFAFRALQLVIYNRALRAAETRKQAELDASELFAVGAASAAVSSLLTTPLDVVRTRMMTQQLGAARLYATAGKCFSATVRAEGYKALMRGALVRSLYVIPATAIFYVVYEMARTTLEERLKLAKAVMPMKVHRRKLSRGARK
ncbi:putative S-adenosylmethionine carrier 2, chloroplastic [Porphyridium purpureum]|uniref:Putative S-adenosylmethionine carrier 2, chloroplastic n=1 Tax=Porphyridium purpureum TaxID=35688 RepID=A0A5J4Z2T3_PORPP|nr:putative S-adenosylmethionine carrier 2, chloroplastic [Porphyridium purpureum]|eukprot:POR2199..scf208_2